MEHAGRKVHVRFDPDDLSRNIKVYDRKGKLLLTAPVIGDVRFLDADGAQRLARLLSDYQKTSRTLRDLDVTMTPAQLGEIYAPAQPVPQAPSSRAAFSSSSRLTGPSPRMSLPSSAPEVPSPM